MTLSLLVCDDHDGATRAIDELDAVSRDGVLTARHVRTARTALQAVATVRVDAVLIDLFLPARDVRDPVLAAGPWLARAMAAALAGRPARPRLLLWTSNPEATLGGRNACRAFIHHGGDHVVDKQHSPARQLGTIEAAIAGETWRAREDGLTERERETLAHMAAGATVKEIARTCFLSTKSVERVITDLRRKLLDPSDQHASGAGPLLAVADAPGSSVSFLPVEHNGDPPRALRALEGNPSPYRGQAP